MAQSNFTLNCKLTTEKQLPNWLVDELILSQISRDIKIRTETDSSVLAGVLGIGRMFWFLVH